MDPQSFPFFHMVSRCEHVTTIPLPDGGVCIHGADEDGYALSCIINSAGKIVCPEGMDLADVLATINHLLTEE